jgi:acetyl esterase/lipase
VGRQRGTGTVPVAASAPCRRRAVETTGSHRAHVDAATEDELDRATVPLGAGNPPTLLLSGGADAVWPASSLCTPAADRLEAAGVRVEQRTYADAGHTLLPPFHPTTPETGGTARGNRGGAVEGWRATWSFLDAELGT